MEVSGQLCYPATVGPRGRLDAVKVKINLPLWLIKHHAMKTYGGMDVEIHLFISSVLDDIKLQRHPLPVVPMVKDPPVPIA
jgi:hypothetical protein